jgi:hypothetical protein
MTHYRVTLLKDNDLCRCLPNTGSCHMIYDIEAKNQCDAVMRVHEMACYTTESHNHNAIPVVWSVEKL